GLVVTAQLKNALGQALGKPQSAILKFENPPNWNPNSVMYVRVCVPAPPEVARSSPGNLCAGVDPLRPVAFALEDADRLVAKLFPIPAGGLAYFEYPGTLLLKHGDSS